MGLFKMKLSTLCYALVLSVAVKGFAPHPSATITTQRNMFGGTGDGMPNEDDPEELKKVEMAAKQMGMSVDEYKLGIRARKRLVEELTNAKIVMGNPETVSVTRDANNPPQNLEVTITEAGKALGKEAVSKELVAALKEGSEKSRGERAAAQKRMMEFISEEMKTQGMM